MIAHHPKNGSPSLVDPSIGAKSTVPFGGITEAGVTPDPPFRL